MPCKVENYSDRRGMDMTELWRSFSRHHTVLELETEALRKKVAHLEDQLALVKKMIPGIAIEAGPAIPPPTPAWRGETYRDKDGKWPADIIEHCDWLSKEDYKPNPTKKRGK